MEKRQNIRGIKHMKSHYKKVSLQQFTTLYGTQSPYRDMKPAEREAALLEDWKELSEQPEKPVRKIDKAE